MVSCAFRSCSTTSTCRTTRYDEWESAGLQAIGELPTSAFSLHDCYGPTWLHRYRELLRKVADVGRLRTLDDVAAEVLLTHAV